MTRLNGTAKETARRAPAIAIEFNQGVEQQAFRMRRVMVFLAVIMLATAIASHAFAAGRMGNDFGLTGGVHGDHVRSGFHGSIIDTAPSMPAPTFNHSNPYTLPRSPENRVSPASPGSIFGNS